MSDVSMKMMEDGEDISCMSDRSMKMMDDGYSQINPKPRRYSAPSAYKSDNVSLLQRDMKFLAKRRAQPWENDVGKVPKLNESHLSPTIYQTTVNQGHIYDLSGSSSTEYGISISDSCVLQPLDTVMDTTTEDVMDPFLPECYDGEQKSKLSAQKIAVGI